MQSLQAVRHRGTTVDADEIPFTWEVMAQVSRREREIVSLLDNAQLGWGRDDAKVIAMGSEQNYDVNAAPGLAALTLDCASQLIWLTESRADLLRAFGPTTDPGWRARCAGERQTSLGPYQIYTSRYHRWSPWGTWYYLGRYVLNGGPDWQRVLGDCCYQIELKARPSPVAVDGEAIDVCRIRFLHRALQTLRSTARILIMHGRRTHPAAGKLGPAFLGVDSLPLPVNHVIEGADGRR
jgi:hypothetical protein